MSRQENITRFTVDIPEDLHRRLKVTAALEKISMHTIVIFAIENELKNLNKKLTK